VWAKLDDALIDHRKIFEAGAVVGKNGRVLALGFYTLGLLWANKHLTDGFLPIPVVKQFGHLAIAKALVHANLWEEVEGGFRIHDFHDHNLKAEEVRTRRLAEHEVKVAAGRRGGLRSAEVRRGRNGKAHT